MSEGVTSRVWLLSTILKAYIQWFKCATVISSVPEDMPLKTTRHPTRWRPKFQSQSHDLYLVWGGYWLKIIFLSKLGTWNRDMKDLCSQGKHSHTWEWKVVWAERVFKKNKSRIPVYPLSTELSYVPMKNVFRVDIRGLWLQVTQRTNIFFAWLHVLDEFFYILNLPELTSQIYSRCSY